MDASGFKDHSKDARCVGGRTNGPHRHRSLLITGVAFLATLGLCLANPPASTADAVDTQSESVAGELIVGFTAGASRSDRREAVAESHASLVRSPGGVSAALVTPKPGTSSSEAVEALRDQPGVSYVEVNSTVRAMRSPSDPMFKDLWGLSNTGQLGGTAGNDIGAAEAWNIVTGGDVKVGIVDTGLDVNHPDLAPNLWTNPADPVNGSDDDNNGFIDDAHGVDFVDRDGDPDDQAGHGSHLAGTIGAAGNNGIGVAGVVWKSQLMGIKFLDGNGAGSMADAANAVDYAVDHGVRIVNASWGGPDYSQALYDAIARANEKGVLFVAAAGNEGEDADQHPMYPAAYDLPNIISVGSTNADDGLSSFSNYGSASVDLAAPGEGILSSVPTQVDPGGYATYGGTSMATAVVSGAAALYGSRFTDASGLKIREALTSSATRLKSLAGVIATGARLNVGRAIGAPIPDRTAPSSFRLLAPAGRRLRSSKRVNFRWQRSYDASGVRSYRVYVDGKLRKTVNDPDGVRGRSASTHARLRLKAGRHSWSVRAVDYAGNVRLASGGKGRVAKALTIGRSR